LKDLLHYFRIPDIISKDSLGNAILDSITNIRYQISNDLIRKDFVGYNYLNLDTETENNLNTETKNNFDFFSLENCK